MRAAALALPGQGRVDFPAQLIRRIWLVEDLAMAHARPRGDLVAEAGGVDDLESWPTDLRHVGQHEAVDSGHLDVSEEQRDAGGVVQHLHCLETAAHRNDV